MICAFVSPGGVGCMLTESQHRLRGWHMAWVGLVPILKMSGDFVPATSANTHPETEGETR